VNRADGISEIEGKGRRGDRASRQGASFKFACHAEAGEGGCLESVFEKNLNSDEHFDRSFSFMGVKRKLQNQEKT
jgi:hypothetical protein